MVKHSTRKDPLIRISVQLTEKDINYLDTFWESRSTALRSMIFEHRVKHQYRDTDFFDKVFESKMDAFYEAFSYSLIDNSGVERLVPTFIGLYETLYSVRPKEEDIATYLNGRYQDWLANK